MKFIYKKLYSILENEYFYKLIPLNRYLCVTEVLPYKKFLIKFRRYIIASKLNIIVIVLFPCFLPKQYINFGTVAIQINIF